MVLGDWGGRRGGLGAMVIGFEGPLYLASNQGFITLIGTSFQAINEIV